MKLINAQLWYKIKPLIPKKAYEPLLKAFYSIRSIKYYGTNLTCPICQNNFKSFTGNSCPKCGAGKRHRVLYLFLVGRTSFFKKRKKVLHIAPEHCFYHKFKALDNLDYITGDLGSARAMKKIDITKIAYPDNYFDVVISSHVLEHVTYDLTAIKELVRVQRNNGWSIHLVPIDYQRDSTLEDPMVNTPQKRLKYYGHHDHKRIYGTDYKNRLESMGFKVRIYKTSNFVQSKEIERFKLDKDMEIYLCRKN